MFWHCHLSNPNGAKGNHRESSISTGVEPRTEASSTRLCTANGPMHSSPAVESPLESRKGFVAEVRMEQYLRIDH